MVFFFCFFSNYWIYEGGEILLLETVILFYFRCISLNYGLCRLWLWATKSFLKTALLAQIVPFVAIGRLLWEHCGSAGTVHFILPIKKPTNLNVAVYLDILVNLVCATTIMYGWDFPITSKPFLKGNTLNTVMAFLYGICGACCLLAKPPWT